MYETAYIQVRFFPVAQSVCLQCGRPGFDPWVGKIPWGRKWQPLQYPCLENPMDGGAWWATVHGVAQGWTRLSDFTFSDVFRTWLLSLMEESPKTLFLWLNTYTFLQSHPGFAALWMYYPIFSSGWGYYEPHFTDRKSVAWRSSQEASVQFPAQAPSRGGWQSPSKDRMRGWSWRKHPKSDSGRGVTTCCTFLTVSSPFQPLPRLQRSLSTRRKEDQWV